MVSADAAEAMDAAASAGSETAEAATDAAGGWVSSCLPQAANSKGRHINNSLCMAYIGFFGNIGKRDKAV